MPLITVDQLYTMIQEDENYQANIQEFLQLNQKIKDAGTYTNVDDISRAAIMFGISPEQKMPGLFNYLIFREELSDGEKRTIEGKIAGNIAGNIRLFALVIDLFSTLFVPGMQLTFPNIGTAMTQQKSRYFYRGENAFYGSSKAGIFRSANRNSPMQKIDSVVNKQGAKWQYNGFGRRQRKKRHF